jgi:hypothetical protein
MPARTASPKLTNRYERTGERRPSRIGIFVQGSGRKAAMTGMAMATMIRTTNGRARRTRTPTAASRSTGRPTYAAASSSANVPSGYHIV